MTIVISRVYKSVDDIDLYLGGFLEAAHGDSILGPVFKCIIGDQFARWVITVHIVVCINVILIFFAILIIIVIIIVIIIIIVIVIVMITS